MQMFHMACPDHPEAALEGYLLDCEITLGQAEKRPAVIVCPGGGYVYCSPREGEPVALAYAAKGCHAFVLRYSIGWDAADFAPLQELSWAIGLLRENAELWHIDPDKIAVCGFSAGGHLAFASGVMGENKPNAMILNYPAIILPNMPKVDYILKLLTGKETVTDGDSERLSLLSSVDKSAPPVFLAATAEDMLTGFGALPVAQKYSQLGLAYELHIFQHGPHGYSLANAATADGSSQMLNPEYAKWLDMSVAWLDRIFGQPEFTDKSTKKMADYLKELGFITPDPGSADFA